MFHLGRHGRQGHSNAVAEMLAGFMLVDRHRVAIDIAGIVVAAAVVVAIEVRSAEVERVASWPLSVLT